MSGKKPPFRLPDTLPGHPEWSTGYILPNAAGEKVLEIYPTGAKMDDLGVQLWRLGDQGTRCRAVRLDGHRIRGGAAWPVG